MIGMSSFLIFPTVGVEVLAKEASFGMNQLLSSSGKSIKLN
jgi:hypothetical protein